MARFNSGGTANWLSLLVQELRDLDHEVNLYCGHVQRGEIEDSNFEGLCGIRIQNLSRSPSIVKDLRAFFEIRKMLIIESPDVLATHTAKAGVLGRLAALTIRDRKFLIVHTFHGHLLYGYYSKIIVFFIKQIEIFLAKHTDVIITSGKKVKHELLDSGIGNFEKMMEINPAVREIIAMDKKKIRKKYGIDPNKIVVGWLGRLVPIKRPDRIVNLAKIFPDIIFLIGGEGILRKDCENKAPENCKFIGWVAPNEIWSASDVAILTSENEAIPLALVEAAWSSLPLIGEDVGSVSEIVISGYTGILTKSDLQRINAVKELSTNPKLRTQFGSASHKIAHEEFSEYKFISNHLIAYGIKN